MENNTEQPKAGAPTKYRAVFPDQAFRLCLLGATNKEIADFFEVNVDTLHEWCRVHKKFSDALQGAKMKADSEVSHSLYRRAIGYTYEEVTYERVGNKGELEKAEDPTADVYKKKTVIREMPGDVGAQTLWLKNRQRDKWRDKIDLNVDFERMTDEQLDSLYERVIKSGL